MLQSIQISNYAIISSLEVRFSKKLTIITGETGAGKSILMGALGLALGDRADLSQMGDKNKKMIIEAIFQVKSSDNLADIMKKLEIDFDDDLKIAKIELDGWKKSLQNTKHITYKKQLKTWIAEFESKFEFLTNLKNKL